MAARGEEKGKVYEAQKGGEGTGGEVECTLIRQSRKKRTTGNN